MPKYVKWNYDFLLYSSLTLIFTPRPTVDARAELAKSAAKLAEDTRVQLRRAEQTSVKKGKYGKHSIEIEEVHLMLPVLIVMPYWLDLI